MLLPLFTKLEGGSLDRRRTAIGPSAGAMVVRRRLSSSDPPARTLFCLACLGGYGKWGVLVSVCTTSPLLIQILPEVSTVREGLFPQDYLSRV